MIKTQSLCGLVLEVKNIPIKIFVEYLDYTNILTSIIILLIWLFKSPAGALKLFIRNDNSFWLYI